jgi:hypothetical protein
LSNQTSITEQSDYEIYRGKCLEFSEKAVAEDPTLTLVRGHYYCPIWNSEEAHWWTVRPDGTIYDPTAKQFPSKGMGLYTPFNGVIKCEECGVAVKEEEAYGIDTNYRFCSGICYGRFVGVC